MTRLPRLVATDLDGTFLSPDGSVSARNAAAVRLAHAHGVAVVFATGRPVRWLDTVRGLWDAAPVVIASNGAMIVELDAAGRHTVLETSPLDADAAVEFVHRARAHDPAIRFAADTGEAVGAEAGYASHPPHDSLPSPRLAETDIVRVLAGHRAIKLLAQHPRLDGPALDATLRPLADGLVCTHSTAACPGLVEVSARGVTKASALAAWCARQGWEAGDVVAFGDMENDAAMLRWAGRGFVTAEAPEALVGGSVRRIGSNADSAVGAELERLLA